MTFQPEQITYHGMPELEEGFLLKPSSGADLSLTSVRFVEALASAFDARYALHERVRSIPDGIESPNERAARYQDELVAYVRSAEKVNEILGIVAAGK
jgi:hypothetical protein